MKKRSFCVFLVFLMLFSVCPVFTFGVSADTVSETEIAPATLFEGAQIRTNGVQALRFVFSLSKDVYEKIEHPETASDTGLGFGTVLMPKKYLGDNKLTKETAVSIDGKSYQAKVVPAVNIFSEDDEYIYYTACITSIDDSNYGSEYVAAPYVTYLDANGKEITVYGDETEDVTVYSVASMAYWDDATSNSVKTFLQEKVFADAVEESFFVTATPHYSLNSEPTYSEDVSILYGTRYDKNDNLICQQVYEFDQLPLDGNPDDYFLSEIKCFVKKDEYYPKNDVVLSALPLLKKQTVSAKDVVIDRSIEPSIDYYVGKDKSNEKVMTGLITLGGTKAYLDINKAPYQYRINNDHSVRFINMVGGCYDETDHLFNFDYLNVCFDGVYDESQPDLLTIEFESAFPLLYNNGFYEADVYDSNGDGYAEYIFVKDYSFFKVIDKEGANFSGIRNYIDDPYIYTGEATIDGSYKSDDSVLAYCNTNAKYVKIADVVEPVTERVISKKIGTKAQIIEFESGIKVDLVNATNKIPSAVSAHDYFVPGQQYTSYIKDGILLRTTLKPLGEYEPYVDYAIVLSQDYDSTNIITTSYIDDATGEYKEVFYVEALIDGKARYVRLADHAYSYSHYDPFSDALVLNQNSLCQRHKITDKRIAELFVSQLVGKFSKYSVNEDNTYVFTEVDIADASSIDTNIIFHDTDAETPVYFEIDNAQIEHFVGNIYTIQGIGIQRFILQDYTKIIIKSFDSETGEYVYTVYDASTFPKFEATDFRNVKAVFINKPDSHTIENLGILYAEVNKFAAIRTNDYRIITEKVTYSTEAHTENLYTVLDIKNNTEVFDVKSAYDGAIYSINQFVTLNSDGKIESARVDAAFYENRLFNARYDYYDAAGRMLYVRDGNTYMLSDDTTVLVYIDSDEHYLRDAKALTLENNPYEELKDAIELNLYIVAEDADNNNVTIKNVKHIVIMPIY